MRIGINTLYMIPGKVGGTESYLRALIRAYQVEDRENEYLLYTGRENGGTFELAAPNFREVRFPLTAESRPKRLLWEQTLLPAQALRDRIDVLHSPGNTGPLLLHCPSVTTLHDVGFYFFPGDWSRAALAANKLLVPAMNRRAARVITDSRSSKNDIVDKLRLPPSQVAVVHLGVDGNLVEVSDGEQRAVRARLALDGDFLFSVSATHAHKNLDGLIRIYGRILESWDAPPPLVIVGVRGQHQEKIERLVSQYRGKGRVVLTGWVTDRELSALYRQARLLVFPTLYEGFGFPPVEAMSVGLPVVSSNLTSLPEVVGDGGVQVDPRDEAAMAEAIHRVWHDEELRRQLIARGYAQAAKFTWKKTAAETLAIYRAVV